MSIVPEPDDNTVVPRKRKGRSINRGVGLDKILRQSDYCPIEVEFDSEGGTWKPVSDKSEKFSRYIGQIVREMIPPYYSAWDKVPRDKKIEVMNRLHEKFHFKYDKEKHPDHIDCILAGVDRQAADIYRNWKNRLSSTYGKNKEEFGPTIARQKKPITVVSDEDWEKTCELFDSPAFQKRSAANKANRQKMKFISTQGTQSTARYRHRRRNLETNELLGPIETFKELHTRKGTNTWINEIAEKVHEDMNTIKKTREIGEPSISEYEIVKQVRGQRRGHSIGIGPQLKRINKASLEHIESLVDEMVNAKIQEALRIQQETIRDMLRQSGIDLPMGLSRGLGNEDGDDDDDDDDEDSDETHSDMY